MSEETPYKADIYDKTALIDEFLDKMKGGGFGVNYTLLECERVRDSWDYLCNLSGDKKRSCGSPYYLHPLRVSYVVMESGFDSEVITAAILHTVFDFDVTKDSIEKRFGAGVLSLIEGAQKLGHLEIKNQTRLEADAVRKMLFALSQDIRVIFLKIADRLDRIRNIKSLEKSRQRALAAEVLDIWAPLADRLGMQQVKNEFEDLSLKYTNNAAFLQIKSVVALKKKEREHYLLDAVAAIKKETDKMGLSVEISSRAKHFFSIYQKMKKRNKDASELFDLFALRIICENTTDCYAILGVIHSLYKPLDGRFKDYIAMPKSNGYQSLHTTVMCNGSPLEVQIRTKKMHDIAEHGAASHALYKSGTNHDLVNEGSLDILNMARDIIKTTKDDEAFKTYKDELFKDEIFVFTPKGQVKRLPQGSCAIDFAYSIHSDIGEHIIAAKADGKIISLTAPLKNTQIVEVITNPAAHPTGSQLLAVKTAKAHQKIHSWLTFNDPKFFDASAQKLRAERQEKDNKDVTQQEPVKSHKKGTKKEEERTPQVRKVTVDGEKNIVVTFAKCCNPTPPNLIAGYISRLRGVVIHRADCLTYLRIPNVENRKVKVEWERD